MGVPGNSDRKESSYDEGDLGSIPGSGRPPGEGNGTPYHCSWLENSMGRGTWQATVHWVTELHTTQQHTHKREKGETKLVRSLKFCLAKAV